MSNARKLLIVLVVLGAIVAVGALAYRIGVQHGLARGEGFRRVMQDPPQNLRGLRDGQPFGRLPFRMRPMVLPIFFGLPHTMPWVVAGAVLIGALVIALYAALMPKPAPVSRSAKNRRKAD